MAARPALAAVVVSTATLAVCGRVVATTLAVTANPDAPGWSRPV
jgi:hypothetical protein